MLWRLRNRVRRDGDLFAIYLGPYALGKFVLTPVAAAGPWQEDIVMASVPGYDPNAKKSGGGSGATIGIVVFLVVAAAAGVSETSTAVCRHDGAVFDVDH